MKIPAIDWMFLLESVKQDKKARYKRNWYAQIRRFLNEKRFGFGEKEKHLVLNKSKHANKIRVIWR